MLTAHTSKGVFEGDDMEALVEHIAEHYKERGDRYSDTLTRIVNWDDNDLQWELYARSVSHINNDVQRALDKLWEEHEADEEYEAELRSLERTGRV